MTFEIPPDVSLPIPIPEHVGVVPNTLLMIMLELGRAILMPNWSQPLLTATRSSPLSMGAVYGASTTAAETGADGFYVRDVAEDRAEASHEVWLACLKELGTPLQHPV
ncbi:pectin lyase-like superfamily protein [Actinidia rufa]|uniref:Pectin lyase-like superfamily protein n=1 Tax=Actinidia rufa TaxID=165716 RepID=A0A7J0EM14_9ERIC|nr:pectin lyase-like superfamily protein [Actinidia rufa]